MSVGASKQEIALNEISPSVSDEKGKLQKAFKAVQLNSAESYRYLYIFNKTLLTYVTAYKMMKADLDITKFLCTSFGTGPFFLTMENIIDKICKFQATDFARKKETISRVFDDPSDDLLQISIGKAALEITNLKKDLV